jgi:hypothetical protein
MLDGIADALHIPEESNECVELVRVYLYSVIDVLSMVRLNVLVLNSILSLVILPHLYLGAHLILVLETQLQIKGFTVPYEYDLSQVSDALHPLNAQVLFVKFIQVCVAEPKY